ncbi:hypothetical protein BgiMline_002151 [Biomphalaria glabrata]|nr:hypothetical protein BgiMline_002022 [Biomphalaria glabrata]
MANSCLIYKSIGTKVKVRDGEKEMEREKEKERRKERKMEREKERHLIKSFTWRLHGRGFNGLRGQKFMLECLGQRLQIVYKARSLCWSAWGRGFKLSTRPEIMLECLGQRLQIVYKARVLCWSAWGRGFKLSTRPEVYAGVLGAEASNCLQGQRFMLECLGQRLQIVYKARGLCWSAWGRGFKLSTRPEVYAGVLGAEASNCLQGQRFMLECLGQRLQIVYKARGLCWSAWGRGFKLSTRPEVILGTLSASSNILREVYVGLIWVEATNCLRGPTILCGQHVD